MKQLIYSIESLKLQANVAVVPAFEGCELE